MHFKVFVFSNEAMMAQKTQLLISLISPIGMEQIKVFFISTDLSNKTKFFLNKGIFLSDFLVA
jgi:hypothetical protein